MARTKKNDRGRQTDRSNCASHACSKRRERRRRGLARVHRLLALSAPTLLLLPAATPAHAYLDPGTGSMILQVILGGVAGLVVAGKLYWKRVRAFFGGRRIEVVSEPDESAHKTLPD